VLGFNMSARILFLTTILFYFILFQFDQCFTSSNIFVYSIWEVEVIQNIDVEML